MLSHSTRTDDSRVYRLVQFLSFLYIRPNIFCTQCKKIFFELLAYLCSAWSCWRSYAAPEKKGGHIHEQRRSREVHYY